MKWRIWKFILALKTMILFSSRQFVLENHMNRLSGSVYQTSPVEILQYPLYFRVIGSWDLYSPLIYTIKSLVKYR